MDMQWNGNYFEFIAQELRRLPDICSLYVRAQFEIGEQLAIRHLLGLLGRLSKNDMGSKDLLCYGLHILAEKQ